MCKIQVLFTASNSGTFLWGFGHNTPPKLCRMQGLISTGRAKTGQFQLAHSRQRFVGLAHLFPVSATQIGIALEIRLDVNLILFHLDFKNL
jgi:hypothetical protein